mgnify:CR=1 FL=1
MQKIFEKSWLYFMAHSQPTANWLFEEKPWEQYEKGHQHRENRSRHRWRWPQAYICNLQLSLMGARS